MINLGINNCLPFLPQPYLNIGTPTPTHYEIYSPSLGRLPSAVSIGWKQ